MPTVDRPQRSRPRSHRPRWLSLAVSLSLAAGPILVAPTTVLAYNNDPVLIGRLNESCNPISPCGQPTYLDTRTELRAGVEFPYSVFVAKNDYDGSAAGHPAGFALTGDAAGSGTGVHGSSDSGTGIYGLANGVAPAVVAENSSGGAALLAKARNGDGIIATTIATNRSALFGENTGGGGYGVVGRTNADLKPGVWGDNIGGGNGVYGLSNGSVASGVYGSNSSDGYGVAGRTGSALRAGTLGDNTGSGPGVQGESAAGTGVLGISHGAAAPGVSGDATASNGIGVNAMASGGGTALSVVGKAKFSRSGTVTIPAGATRVTKTGVMLNTASFVLATLQAYRAGIAVAAVVPNAAAGSFTIYLTKAVTSSTRVAWFVVN